VAANTSLRLPCWAAFVVAVGLVAAEAGPAGGYGIGRLACHLSDPRITESSGVASASWGDDFIWTHNDSGDEPRFFAVDTATCAVRAVYDLAGARADDWEDMTRSGTTLHFGDIGDNDARRASVTVYDAPEPARDAPSGPITPSATRVLTYPDGPHDAESLFVDPTTGRLAIVTKAAPGEAALYLAPLHGNGMMERVAAMVVASATGADATADRIIVRDYLTAYEWALRPGETLAGALRGIPGPIVLPITPQGEAIAYARNGSGLWTTSERRDSDGPVHFIPADGPLSSLLGAPSTASQGRTSGDASGSSDRPAGDGPLPLALAIGVPAGLAALLIVWLTRRRR
jgi:hypothetical protein